MPIEFRRMRNHDVASNVQTTGAKDSYISGDILHKPNQTVSIDKIDVMVPFPALLGASGCRSKGTSDFPTR